MLVPGPYAAPADCAIGPPTSRSGSGRRRSSQAACGCNAIQLCKFSGDLKLMFYTTYNGKKKKKNRGLCYWRLWTGTHDVPAATS